MYKKTEQHGNLSVGAPNDPRWISTIEIASYNDLNIDRVRYICSIHEKIRPKMNKDLWPTETLEEKWAVREFVN